MSSVTFYVWAAPAFLHDSPVDHTWVTTYDNRTHTYQDIAEVKAAGEDNWYCWGGFHPKGGTPGNPDGALGQRSADRAIARCLVKTNADSRKVKAARGTIFKYGVDGVCHQLTNQVLLATGPNPLKASNARGYWLSTYLYHDYGRQSAAWAKKIAECGAVPALAATPSGGIEPGASAMGDDFEDRAREVLGRDDPDLLAQLLALRNEASLAISRTTPGEEQSAEALNARNQRMFDAAAELLGAERFEQLFGFPAGTRIDLVDPQIFNSAEDE